MAASLPDGKTFFFSPEAWRNSRRSGSSEVPDPGYSTLSHPKGRLVWEVLPGSEANKSGLQPGDIIVAINGVPLGGPDVASVTTPAMLGQVVELTIERGPEEHRISVTLGSSRSVLTFRQIGSVAYVRIFTFLTTPEQIALMYESDLRKLLLGSLGGLIIDLRNNTGGRGDASLLLAELAGYSGIFARYDGRYDIRDRTEVATAKTSRAPGRTVILVNRQSSSAAEIFASALQTSGFAHVIGEKTPGSTNAINDFRLAGSAMSVTTVRTYSGPNLVQLNGVGVQPNELVELDAELLRAGRDSQLERARAYLLEKLAR